MKSAAKIVTMGFIGLVIFVSACSQDKDYSKKFSTPNDAPMCSYDVAKYENGLFTGIGWAADKEDGAPLKKILVYVDGKPVGEAKYYTDRPDVVSMYKNDVWLKSGWQVLANIPLNKGVHRSMALSFDSGDAVNVAVKDFNVE